MDSNGADIRRSAAYSPTAMNPQNTGGWLHFEKSALRERVRKAAIVLLLLGLLLPPLLVNIGVNAEQAGWAGPLPKLNRPLPSLQALLLCQQWTLFSQMSPFNFTLHFQVELIDGQVVPLRDLDKERARKWESVLFHNEPKSELNLYSDPGSQRLYLEYLVRTNGLDPLEIARRTIYIRYQNILPRDQAAVAGTYYGPETNFALDTY
jgi:hypothetical protein